jgi:type I restriction enzyme, S subunit
MTPAPQKPAMWRRVHVADVCETVSVGIVIQPSQYYVAPSQGIRAFRSANVGENRIVDRDWVYLSPEGHRANSKSSLRAGDVLVVRSGAPGTACVVTEEYAGSNCIDIVFARPHQDQVLPEYLAEFTNSPVGRRHVLGTQGGLALKHFNVGAYKQLELLLPDVAEQKKIVNLFAAWDTAIQKSEELIAAKERHYSHELSHLISRGQHPHTHVDTFAEEVSARNRGGNEARVLSVTNSRGFVLPEDQFERRVASADLSNYKVVRRGQYAYNPSRINVGSIARLDGWDDGVLSPMYVVFRLDESKANSDYFLHWLNSHEARQRIKNSAQGSVRETVSFSEFAAITIPLPDSNTQTAIARYLNALREEIDLLGQTVAALKTQKRGLMQKLLTGQWRLPVQEEAN